MKKSNVIKKFLVILLLVMFVTRLTACGTYQSSTMTDGDDEPGNNGGNGNNGSLFTVNLVDEEGKAFVPPIPMFAQWRGDDGIYSAPFDNKGYASIDGLDGDYHVTLSTVPSGYTYDPNGYMVDNNKKGINVTMLKIQTTRGSGSNEYNAITLSNLGTYRVTLDSRTKTVFYEYEPFMEGRYSIQSWVDISENEINPIMEVYTGTKSYKLFNRTQDGGGASSSYTINFKLELELTHDMIGNVWSFGVHADCRSGNYPISVDFTITYEGEYVVDDSVYENVYAQGPFGNSALYASVRGLTPRYIYEDTDYRLDGSRVKLNPDDGFYHLYDAKTDTYGAVLFVYLSVDSELLVTESHTGFLDSYVCPWLSFNGLRYYWEMPTADPDVWVRDPNCFLSQYVDHGFDGAHPVTEELKNFLFAYSLGQRFFNDGNGWAETPKENENGQIIFKGLKSTEEDQWLFNCFYYV